MLSPEEVRHIAKLARLRLTEEEAEKMGTELTSILSYVDQLKEVDTSDVPPTAQVTGGTAVLRADAVRETDASPEDMLACSPLPVIDGQISVPSAHG